VSPTPERPPTQSTVDPRDVPVPVRNAAGRWDLSQATAFQKRLRERVEHADRIGPVRRVAGADVSYNRGDDTLYAAVVVVDLETLDLLETSAVVSRATFPYLPGYLSFREAPAVAEALRGIGKRPDLLLVDGHGVAHPRGFGLACHLGLLLDLPTIGVGKSVLVGKPGEPGLPRGSMAPLVHEGRRIATVLRTRDRVNPVYVSIGHRVSLATAEKLVMRSTGGYRVPEPTRQAHRAVNELRAEARGKRDRHAAGSRRPA
jgi:deoxyribonuclease V